jgi:hypothetical protein
MRDSDVSILLDQINKKLKSIKAIYDQSLQDKNIPDSLRVEIKNTMENLRSCLDYMAQDVNDSIITPYRNRNNLKVLKKIYFPYGKNEYDFISSIKKNLPDLKTLNPDLFSIIEDIQPHSSQNPWLYDFCSILNDNKHMFLSTQTKLVNKTYTVGIKGQTSISALAGSIKASPGQIAIAGIPIQFDSCTGIPKQVPGLEINVKKWINFVFSDTKIKVYPQGDCTINYLTPSSLSL